MWLKVEGGLVEADLVLDGCPTARMAITQSGGTTTERIGAWQYRVARTTAGKTIGAVLDLSGGSVFLYTVGVSDQVFEAVLASVQVLTGDEWRSYRDSLPKATISK